MGDERGTDSDPDRVVPPAPFDTGQSAATTVPPLAPPLSGGAPPHPVPPPAFQPTPPLPPYAVGAHPAAPSSPAPTHPAAYPAPPYPAPPYPAPPYPASPPSSNRLGIGLAVAGGVVVLAVVGVAVAIGSLLGVDRSPSIPLPPTAVAEDPDAPTDAPADSAPEVDTSDIAARLEAKIDEYKRLRDSGALWQSIPDTDFSRTAVSAFLYFLTDMKVATIWGVDEQQAQEYDERMAMLEERLLAQEPLGDDISITLEDKVFTYDGETGEGGYTAK